MNSRSLRVVDPEVAHPRDLARTAVKRYREKQANSHRFDHIIYGHEARQHQVWPVEGLWDLLKDRYVNGVYVY